MLRKNTIDRAKGVQSAQHLLKQVFDVHGCMTNLQYNYFFAQLHLFQTHGQHVSLLLPPSDCR